MQKRITHQIYLLGIAFVLSTTTSMGTSPVVMDAIHIASQASKAEEYAAEELQHVVKVMTGKQVPILKGNQPPVKGCFVLGTPKSSQWVRKYAEAMDLDEYKDSDEVAIYTIGQNLYLGGHIPRGVLFSVYAYAQKFLGVRWFMPTEKGEYIPRRESIVLPDLHWHYASPFYARALSLCGVARQRDCEIWMARNFINVHITTKDVCEKTDAIRCGGGHSVALYNSKLYDQHPEYYAMLDGTRTRKGFMGCWSNPDFFRYMVDLHIKMIDEQELQMMSIFPADSGYQCECENCQKLGKAGSERWFHFYDLLVAELKKKRPHVKYHTIAYLNYRDVPKYKIKHSDFIQYCMSEQCILHPLGDERCQLNNAARAMFRNWQRMLPCGFYGYEYDAFNRFIPIWRNAVLNARTFRDLNTIWIKNEYGLESHPPKDIWQSQRMQQMRISAFAFAQAWWNPDIDPDQLLGEWCAYFYGPAATAMEQYHLLFEKTWSSHRNIHLYAWTFNHKPMTIAARILTPRFCRQAEKLLMQAKAKVSAPQYAFCLGNIDIDEKIYLQWHADMLQGIKLPRTLVQIPKAQDFEKASRLPVLRRDITQPSLPTEMAAYWNEDGLHLRVTAEGDVKQVRDNDNATTRKHVWSLPQIVEYYLGNGSGLCRFAVSALNAEYSARNWDITHSFLWKHNVVYTSRSWTLDTTFDFSDLDVYNPCHGQRLYARIMRGMTSPYQTCGFAPGPDHNDFATLGCLRLCNNYHPERKLLWLRADESLHNDDYLSQLADENWSYVAEYGSAFVSTPSDFTVILMDAPCLQQLPMERIHLLHHAIINGRVLVINPVISSPQHPLANPPASQQTLFPLQLSAGHLIPLSPASIWRNGNLSCEYLILGKGCIMLPNNIPSSVMLTRMIYKPVAQK